MMSFIKKNWVHLLPLLLFLFLPLISFGEGETCDPGTICNPIPSVGSLPDLIRIILQGIIRIGIPIIALAIIYSGFLFVFARGNPEKLTTAKHTFLGTLAGGALLLGAWALAEMISSTVDALA